MDNIKKKSMLTLLAVIIAIALALLCKLLSASTGTGLFSKMLEFVRIFIYVGLFASWGVSLGRRIVNVQTKKFFYATAFFMVFLISVREIKIRFVTDPLAVRYLNYVCYIPLIFIPALALLISLSSRQTGERVSSAVSFFILVTSSILSLAVITNDVHKTVFLRGATYGAMYYIIAVFAAATAASAVIIFLKKSKRVSSGKAIIIPLIPVAIAAIYAPLYKAKLPPVSNIFDDPAVILCLAFVAFYEGCIYAKLIQSNSLFDSLFVKSKGISAEITDANLIPRLSTKEATKLHKRDIQKALRSTVTLKDGSKLSSAPVEGGYVLWTDRTSDAEQIKETLAEKEEQIQDRNTLLNYENEKDMEYRRLIKEGTSSKSATYSPDKLELIKSYIEKYSSAKTDEEKRSAANKISLIGSFIKRRADIVLSKNKDGMIPSVKLTGALAESYRSLELGLKSGSYSVESAGASIDAKSAEEAYMLFERVSEALPEGKYSIDTAMICKGDSIALTIKTDANISLENTKVTSENGLTVIRAEVKGGSNS